MAQSRKQQDRTKGKYSSGTNQRKKGKRKGRKGNNIGKERTKTGYFDQQLQRRQDLQETTA
jgi:hypothetical protein